MSDSTSARPTLEFDVHFQPGHRGKRNLAEGTAPTAKPQREGLPRVTRLLALAHRWNDLMKRGEIQDQAEIGRLMGITRARVTQIMNLRFLSPRIQEEVLNGGLAAETLVRGLVQKETWQDQHDLWEAKEGCARRCATATRIGQPDLS